jgi:hypothetical protein
MICNKITQDLFIGLFIQPGIGDSVSAAATHYSYLVACRITIILSAGVACAIALLSLLFFVIRAGKRWCGMIAALCVVCVASSVSSIVFWSILNGKLSRLSITEFQVGPCIILTGVSAALVTLVGLLCSLSLCCCENVKDDDPAWSLPVRLSRHVSAKRVVSAKSDPVTLERSLFIANFLKKPMLI